MFIDEYQERAMTTCLPTCANWTYAAGLLHEEAGELQGKVDKAIRKGYAEIDHNILNIFGTAEQRRELEDAMMAELGDVMWACACIATSMGWSLDAVAEKNLGKLAARKTAGTIAGEGDGISGKDRRV